MTSLTLPISLPDAALGTGSFHGVSPLRSDALLFKRPVPRSEKEQQALGSSGEGRRPHCAAPPAPPGPQAHTALAAGPAGALGEPACGETLQVPLYNCVQLMQLSLWGRTGETRT